MRKPKAPLLNRVADAACNRTGCAVYKIGSHDLIVIQRRDAEIVETLNADGFNPYERRRKVTLSRVFRVYVEPLKDTPNHVEPEPWRDGSIRVTVHNDKLDWLEAEPCD